MDDAVLKRIKTAAVPMSLGAVFILGLIVIQVIRSGTKPPDLVAWQTSFSQASQTAARENRPILIDFYASWCPACQFMDSDVWSDPGIAQQIAADYVPLLADVDKPDGGKLAKQYQIPSLPTILIVSAGGSIYKGGLTMDKLQMQQFLRQGAWATAHQPATLP
ncbi:MAG TPA: thioredoxin family protein [Phycisphaerae bacterium]|nr:thioredoxin family protein [Phycisphaerae bacterium]